MRSVEPAMVKIMCPPLQLKDWKSYKHEDNTVFTPKQEWAKRELESVSGQIEQLSGKKQKLEKILQTN